MRILVVATFLVAALAAAAGQAEPALLRAYLIAWLLWLGVGLGALVFLCVHHLVRGRWGDAVGPLLVAATRTIPLLALAFLPLALGLERVYPWTDLEWLQAAPLRAAKAPYLETSWFVGRALLVLAVWSLLAARLARAQSPRPGLAALTLVVFFPTVTLAAVDWVLSLDPDMITSAIGLALATGDALAGWSVVVLAAAFTRARSGAIAALVPDRVHELGTLLFVALMLWGYIAFTQYLLVWGADLPREAGWYVARTTGGWGAVAWSLVGLHFAVPFIALLMRPIKRDLSRLAVIAGLLLLMHAVELLWLVVPARAQPLLWLDIAVPLALGGLWALAFSVLVRRADVIAFSGETGRA